MTAKNLYLVLSVNIPTLSPLLLKAVVLCIVQGYFQNELKSSYVQRVADAVLVAYVFVSRLMRVRLENAPI